jgi:hypothetical protein
VVTIALAEADSAEIEKRRAELAEPYAACSAISASKSATIIGIFWFATAANSGNAARHLETIRRTTKRL